MPCRDNALGCRRYRRRLRTRVIAVYGDLFGLYCYNCGRHEEIEMAHVEPTGLQHEGRGQTRRFIDILRYPGSYIPLCHDCHVEFDRGTDLPFVFAAFSRIRYGEDGSQKPQARPSAYA
jgi:hypothetical protein